jgi:uncharacterized protein YoxC
MEHLSAILEVAGIVLDVAIVVLSIVIIRCLTSTKKKR